MRRSYKELFNFIIEKPGQFLKKGDVVSIETSTLERERGDRSPLKVEMTIKQFPSNDEVTIALSPKNANRIANSLMKAANTLGYTDGDYDDSI